MSNTNTELSRTRNKSDSGIDSQAIKYLYAYMMEVWCQKSNYKTITHMTHLLLSSDIDTSCWCYSTHMESRVALFYPVLSKKFVLKGNLPREIFNKYYCMTDLTQPRVSIIEVMECVCKYLSIYRVTIEIL